MGIHYFSQNWSHLIHWTKDIQVDTTLDLELLRVI